MRFELSKKVEADLVHIIIEGSRQFGVAQAQRYRDGLWKTFELLGDFPRLGVDRGDIFDGIRSHTYQSHVILYSKTDDRVLIVTIRHGREDWRSGLD